MRGRDLVKPVSTRVTRCCGSRALVVLTGSALVSLLSACGGSTSQAEYHMDYPSYASVSEMCRAASLVVVGEPVGATVLPVNILASDQGDSPEENPALGTTSDPKDSLAVETVTSFQVREVIQGDRVLVGDVVAVGQPGGLYEGVDYSADQYSMKAGKGLPLVSPGVPRSAGQSLEPCAGRFRVVAGRYGVARRVRVLWPNSWRGKPQVVSSAEPSSRPDPLLDAGNTS